jgi:predicted nucleic acid-binding protein
LTVVDSTVWIDALNGINNRETLWLIRSLEVDEISLTDLILCEVLQGIGEERLYREAREDLLRFTVHNTGGADLAVAAAENYRRLRRRGITIRRTVDCLIATYCIRGGHALLHHDRDFDPFEEHLGLQVIHP